MSLSHDDIKSLITAFESSTWDEMTLQVGDTRLQLSRNGAPSRPLSTPATVPAPAPAADPAPAPAADPAPAPAAVPAAAAAPAAPTHAGGHHVTSPSLGLFWRSPQPGAPPFAEVWQQVHAEDTVCIIEVMKLMNHVKAGVSGTVVEVLVDNGEMVEFGQPLIVIEPGE